jgi:hypothetical protein
MAKKQNDPGERPTAIEWLTSHKWPRVLPTAWLTDAELEDFTEALLTAQRLLGANVRHVAHVERWGVPGDKQDGIDFFGHFNDDVPAAWQCKQLVKFGAAEVRDAVAALTFEGAEEHYLVYGGVAKKQARDEVRNHPTWTLIDRRTLTEMVRLLPAHAQRDLIERFWGAEVRQLFVEAPEDGFISLGTFKHDRLNPAAVMNDLGPMAGRATELTDLLAALTRGAETFRQVVVVTGPGGRGKSRLVVEALAAQQEREPTIPIVCLSARHTFDAAAMSELRPVPSIVFIDDAHNNPKALSPLLAALRSRPDIQVILATRPSALSAVEEEISLALFGPEERTTIEVAELELPQARELVKGLTGDLDLRFEMRNYLADQATHSPHVAVITTNLIRRRKLTAVIAVDENLRELVLARYQELLIPGDIEGFEAKTTQRVIATYASLEPVEKDDEALKTRIAAFCNLSLIELAQLVRILTDRGVLVEQNDKLRVVPELLADRLTEMTAAVEGYDTGFVAELWNEFGSDHHHRLALSLGELDWRLARSGGPNVMKRVWDAIRERLQTPYCSRLCDEFDQLEQLAATQPAELIAALDELRERLDQEDRDGLPVPEDPDDKPYRLLWRLHPRGRNDVRAKMPKLYARAAANDPDVLERALDALWDLRKNDARPTNSNPDHAERMVADHLANLATLPDRSFPERIVARAATWLEQPEDGESVATPLFVLTPLLAKNELETVQSSFRSLQFKPHLISAKAMRPVRDQIRTLLLQQGKSADLRLAGAAVSLLGEALHAPHGYFGQAIGTDAVLQWADDDLASIATLEQVAEQTPSPVIRRQVRTVVSWTAEHATSLHLQHAAITLAARLDAEDDLEDQVAEFIFNGAWDRSLAEFDQVPTLEELDAQRQAEHERTKDFTEQEAQDDRMAHIRLKIEAREARVAVRNHELARRLIELGDTSAPLALLDSTARAVQQVRKDKHIILWSLWQQIEQQAPELLGHFATGIAANAPGPLDNDLDLIIDRWVRLNPQEAIAWVDDAVRNRRKEIRLAIAAGFTRFIWHEQGSELSPIWAQGLADEDSDVVQAFLAGAGGYLRTSPIEAVETLLNNDISVSSATRALESACSYDGRGYGSCLDLETATAMLPLITRADLSNHAIQEMITGIAFAHPDLVLDYLAEFAHGEGPPPDDIYELRTAFDPNTEALAQWVRNHLDEDPSVTGCVLHSAVNEQLTPTQAEAFVGICSELTGPELTALVESLAPLKLWAVNHRLLAEAVMQRARETNAAAEIGERIRVGGVSLNGWGWVNGVSDELNHAHAQSQRAAEETTDEGLRVEYEAARDRFKVAIDEIAQEHAKEEEEGLS